jgi:hypothetical protein
MAILYGWMDYVTGGPMEWMEMDTRAIHSTAWTKWTVDVEWIATLHCNQSVDEGDQSSRQGHQPL